ncbi:MAG: D-amino acid aminotransferase [candidate division KSB1 bacterium]|nr:D-amino acid aminotransferase [candidate division KSB1 bacterium]MDZ7273948.1 D-amino acid aminotransferase [candidate division KSB1 bacterium]MDZ7286104.1 D-amino acid aminotransferase [candidate division KSB1 bacterium]MDZ7299136.1 D-amino acid aminotransferase [candidate division KSB1 bacterium]MDZ7308333.1 D-amino acid aminotransferase [candidate division KSB1 bacterium]
MLVYLNGNFVPASQACIPVHDRGFLFGDGVYEVIRSYGGRLFASAAHLRRLENGLSALQIPLPQAAELPALAGHLLQKNGLQRADALIYFQVTRGAALPRRHYFPPPDTPPTVYIATRAFTPPSALLADGVAAITVPDIRWQRCDLKTINLLPNVLASQQAHAVGADEAIFIHAGAATEASHSNFFAVFHGRILTHPGTQRILPGITRAVVLELCRQLHVPVEETAPVAALLPHADELFLSRTSGEVVPVVQLDGQSIADGRPGPITRRLQQAFAEYVAQHSA